MPAMPDLALPALVFSFVLLANTVATQDPVALGPASQCHPDVPRGEVREAVWRSEVFAGTVRRYWVYVPRQYDGSEPAAVMVFQDGHAYVGENGDFRVPIVFDNLIAAGEMPITVGVFVDPGHTASELPEQRGWAARPNNRSFEYDTLSDQYARFLTDEILPEVGRTVKLTGDARNRAICGISSGGICAFTVAWQRPEVFSKVLSHVGSFTDIASGKTRIEGGHNYPSLIRKTKQLDKLTKPIRVFLQDGANDLDNEHGNWFLANQQMAAALHWAGYDCKTEWGTGGHDGKHGGAILPDSLRWLWRDWRDAAGK
ncbi:MAG TPA: alpha/beta hydrolase-fold protein [Planctomycetota bacterium]|nr:alpha/beta hydrolase-fold protein [Planctomycetota bacterium]